MSEDSASSHHLGVLLGASLASMSMSASNSTIGISPESRSGFAALLTYDYDFSSYLLMSPGLGYAQKGFGMDVTVLGAKFDAKANLHYLTLPVLVKASSLSGSSSPSWLPALMAPFS